MSLKTINIENLESIMQQLRDPHKGCPWDIEQSYQSILPFTIEEVYEVADAIEREDYSDLKNELGDLLFQVVFYARLAEEDGYFDLSDVVDSISNKLVRRHPHVFSFDGLNKTKEQVSLDWENQKQKEREAKVGSEKNDQKASLLDDIPKVLPELKRAQKIQKRVAKQGFDWPDVQQVWDKLAEESLEVKEAAESNDFEHLQEEIGDLLFVCVNLARHYKVDADFALRKANNKFESRFRHVEELASHNIADFTLDELEQFWKQAKKAKLD
jgi:ATP diphosphatase